MKICIKCNISKSLDNFYRCDRIGKLRNECKTCRIAVSKAWRLAHPERFKEKTNLWYLANHEKMLENERLKYYKLKKEMFEVLGRFCNCCNESDTRFLTLDHRNNDGYLERQNGGQSKNIYLAKSRGWPTDKYQILCYNCNLGKRANKGKCPHKSEVYNALS